MGGINHKKWVLYYCYTHIIPFSWVGLQEMIRLQETIHRLFPRHHHSHSSHGAKELCSDLSRGAKENLHNVPLWWKRTEFIARCERTEAVPQNLEGCHHEQWQVLSSEVGQIKNSILCDLVCFKHK